MVGVVTVTDHELLSRREVAFNAIHPGGIRCSEYEVDIVPLAPIDDLSFAVRSHNCPGRCIIVCPSGIVVESI